MDNVELSAKLTHIIFENKANHYIVGQFSDTKTYHIFTATGYIPNAQEDITYLLKGQYVQHPRYGKQFKILSFEKELPNSNEAIIRFLSGDDFPTIGKKTAETIYEILGEDCLIQIKENPDCLSKIPKLNKKKKEILIEGIQSFEGFSKTYSKLISYGLPVHKIALLEEHYKDLSSILEENCFRPYYEVDGFGYKSACKIADGLELDSKDKRRQDAFIHERVGKLCMGTGDTYVSIETLLSSLAQVDPSIILEALERLEAMQALEVIDHRIYPFHLYEEEQCIAHQLYLHTFKTNPIDEETLNQYIKEVEFSNVIEYDQIQVEAIRTFFSKSLMILNGGPGTGKTTIVKGILQMLKSIYPDAIIQLCAPTGRASKRLAQLSNYNSKTIHSLLKWNMDNNTFGANEDDPILADFIIIDEFSMVDTHLFANLLLALPKRCRILLIGDENQLESVGPGKVFQDLISSNQIPIVHLEKIYRQSHGSGIVELASQIRNNQPCEYKDGVTFIERNTQEILQSLLEISSQYPLDSMQVLAPMYAGAAGIDQINTAMQMLFNPKEKHKKEVVIGNYTFRENDKVMLLKNLPDDDVYNGDIGKIIEIEKTKQEQRITVEFDSTIVDFTSDFLYYLKLAYCISIHKSQGSEYPVVFCIADHMTSHMLNQRTLYTAISRAKKELFILGQTYTFEQSIQLKQTHIRQTTLQEIIKKEFES